MNTPFDNDMFSLIYQAFKGLYPEQERSCVCYWTVEPLKDNNGNEAYGCTTFSDDGVVYVEVSAKLQVINAIEILAHELAHVAVGSEANHGEEWEHAFDAILTEYNRICNVDTPHD